MARPQYPSDLLAQFMVRMPEGLRERIKAAAADNNRSMNAEIVATLEEAYPEDGFEYGEFLQRFTAAISKAKSDAERQEILKSSNEELQLHNTGWRVEFTSAGDNPSFRIIVGESD